jgi:uncharacterized protein YjbI with pentapeptide repeats
MLRNLLKELKKKETVSRFHVELKFEWNTDNSKILRSADLSCADLSYADLRCANLSYANLSFADLSSAKGQFFFNLGVKLQVVKE